VYLQYAPHNIIVGTTQNKFAQTKGKMRTKLKIKIVSFILLLRQKKYIQIEQQIGTGDCAAHTNLLWPIEHPLFAK
jgi:hypothetical protein